MVAKWAQVVFFGAFGLSFFTNDVPLLGLIMAVAAIVAAFAITLGK